MEISVFDLVIMDISVTARRCTDGQYFQREDRAPRTKPREHPHSSGGRG